MMQISDRQFKYNNNMNHLNTLVNCVFYKNKKILCSYYLQLIGGFIFAVIFFYRYAAISPDLYTARDDGIITMSHAKNLIDFGFIGVGPSGERVEGYSAPTQFFAYAALYYLTGLSYWTYANIQTISLTFLLGAIYASFFIGRKFFLLIASSITAFALTWQTSFFEWHGSGMENAITHSLFALTVYVLFYFARSGKISIFLAVVPFLASISRLDSIYHIFPLLAVFAIYWIIYEKSYKSIGFMMVTLVLWFLYNLWRYFYFGDISPNTAYAQGISVSDRVSHLLRLDNEFLQEATQLSRQIFSSHGGFYLMLLVPLLPFVRFDNEWMLLFMLCLSLVLTAWLNPIFFGPTRLDVTRSTTQMAFFTFLAISVVIYSTPRSQLLLFSPLLFMLFSLLHTINYVSPYNLCCNPKNFDEIRGRLQSVAKAEVLKRPTISNPDLGVVSWYKEFNILDLGMLGSTILSRVKAGALRADYFFDFAAPDLIEVHDWWKCGENIAIFSDPRFFQEYRLIESYPHAVNHCGVDNFKDGIYIRKNIERNSGSTERKLLDDLVTNFSLDRISHELDLCHDNYYDKEFKCSYISRTVYRFIPELKSNGQLEKMMSLLQERSGNAFDLFLASGSYDTAHAYETIKMLFKSHLINNEFKKIGSKNGFTLYISDTELAVYNESCGKIRELAPFYVHVIPISEADKNRVPHGFVNLDFNIKSDGVFTGSLCGAVRKLPYIAINNIFIGQWLPAEEKELWEVNIDLGEVN
jgi:hypothetical protein